MYTVSNIRQKVVTLMREEDTSSFIPFVRTMEIFLYLFFNLFFSFSIKCFTELLEKSSHFRVFDDILQKDGFKFFV